MALLGNYSVLHKSPSKYMAGTVASGDRAAFNKAGAARNLSMQAEGGEPLLGIPHGFGAFGAWMLPVKAGAMVSRRLAEVSIAMSGNGAEGMGMAGEATLSLDAAGFGGLIAGGVAVAPIVVSAVGAVTATIGTDGAATMTMAGSAAPGALGWLVGGATITVNGAVVSYARGHMTGTTEEQGLTVAGVTNAVWSKILDSGFNAAEIMRLLAAHAAGDAAGLESGAPEFKSLDGAKTRIAGTYSAGTREVTARDASE